MRRITGGCSTCQQYDSPRSTTRRSKDARYPVNLPPECPLAPFLQFPSEECRALEEEAMKWAIPVLTTAALLSVTPLMASSAQNAKELKEDLKGREIVMRGCVQQGVKHGEYVLEK